MEKEESFTDSAVARHAAQARSNATENNYRQHVVKISKQTGREFIVCSDSQLARIKSDNPSSVWCGGYYKGAFTG